MATEISRVAGAGTEDSAAADATVDPEVTIQPYFAFAGIGPIPIDPTADGGVPSGYASEETAPAQTGTEDSSTIA